LSLSAGQPWRRLAAILSVALVVSGSQLQPAHAETSAPAVPAARVVTATQSEGGASADEDAIVNAAEKYESGDAKAAAALADAASAADALPMAKTKDGLALETDDGTAIEVAKDGDVTLSAPGMPEIGLSVAGDPEQTKVVGGALVQTEVAPSTDVVTRATENGVQMVAVLADASAPSSIEFPIDLPTAARLVSQPDGSITVFAPVEVEKAEPGELERFAADMRRVLGDAEVDPTELTDSELAELAAIRPVATYVDTEDQAVAVLGKAWAVDANGAQLTTHYEVEGAVVRQVVDVNTGTAFPVTADPWWSWLVDTAKSILKSSGVALGNTAFAWALGGWIAGKAVQTGGACRWESSRLMYVCWGGALSRLDGYGGGTTYGITFYARSDPKNWTGMTSRKYADLLAHEAEHATQWKLLGPGFAAAYLAAEGIGRVTTGASGCGNIFEVMADLKKGNYTC